MSEVSKPKSDTLSREGLSDELKWAFKTYLDCQAEGVGGFSKELAKQAYGQIKTMLEFDWVDWAFKLGYKLDFAIPWAGVDNRKRLEKTIDEWVKLKKPIPEERLKEFVEKWTKKMTTAFYHTNIMHSVKQMLKEYDELKEGE